MNTLELMKAKKEDIFNGDESFFHSLIFENAMTGLIVVDNENRLVTASDHMFNYFELNPISVKGRMFGDVFKCAEILDENFRCGKSLKCKNCKILKAINSILNKEGTLENETLRYQFIINGEKNNKWLNVSGKAVLSGGRRYAVLSLADITKEKHYEEVLQQRLILDLATGTMNKYSLLDSIRDIIDTDEDTDFTVCMTDFDNFKDINDRYGHLMGDEVLETFSNIAKRHLKKKDILGRYGGEEFLFIFKGSSEAEALKIIKDIHKELKDEFSGLLEQAVTFSAGILLVKNIQRKECHCTDIIGRVDKLLYKAKKQGRNRAIMSTGEIVFE